MSEEKNERNDEELAESKNHVSGYFDSLIADFSLEEQQPSEKKPPEDSGEVEVETVDGITVESIIKEVEEAETEPEVIFDVEAPVQQPQQAPPENMPPEEEQPEKKKGGIIAFLFPVKGDAVGEVIRKIVFLIAVSVFAVAGVLLVTNLTDSQAAIEDQKKDKKIIVTTVATTINDKGEIETIPPTEEEIQQHNFSVMEYYKSISENIIGFLEVPGCEIAEPVVQGTDNEYYLKHTYEDERNQAGALFMDYRCSVTEDHTSPNIVIYGHNQRDGTKFGTLKLYKYDLDFYAKNPIITFTTEYSSSKYVIFGYFVTNTLEKQDSNGEVFRYHDYIETLSNPGTFGWYMNQIKRRNQIISPVDVTYGDELLVLSTCSNEFSDSRFAVFARKLREGETEDSFDFEAAEINRSAKGIDWNAVLSAPTRATRATSATTVTSETVSETTTAVPSETTTRRNAVAENFENIFDSYSDIFTTAPPSDDDGGTTKRRRKTTAETTEETVPPADEDSETESSSSRKKKTTAETTEETTQKTKKKTQATTAASEEETSEVTTVPETSASEEEVTETASAEETGENSQ